MKLSFSFNTQRGNLDSRSNNAFSTAWSESFSYDNLDRLTNFNDNNGNKSQSYDGQGRITASSRLGTYTYDTSSPYRQIGLSNLSSYALYHYQNNPLHQVTYNAFKSPVEIYEQGKERISYQYDASESRSHAYYGSDNADKMARPMRRHYSEDGSMEITEDLANSKTSFVFYLGGDAYSAPAIYKEEHASGTTGNLYYLHRDHLGSINLITDASGNLVEKRAFDAWGSIVKLQDGSGNDLTAFLIIDRGYTGHEHLLGVGLIHMNARLYDPVLHRFLSPDNYVQDPTNTQNFNRYGYVLNNPLKYTDESGEFIHLLIGAAIGGTVNWLTHGAKFSWKGLGYFGVGAAAGALSAGIGSGISSSLAGGSFGAGFMGSTAAKTVASSFINGALIGGGSGLSGGFVSGFGNGLVGGNGFGQSLGAGIRTGLLGGLSGGVIGGIAGGIDAALDHRQFFDGATVDNNILVDQNIPIVGQVGENNCLPASAEAVDRSLGGTMTQGQIRGLPGLGGDPNTTPLLDGDTWSAYTKAASRTLKYGGKGMNGVSSIYPTMQSGGRVALSLNTGTVGHEVIMKSMVLRTVTKINGSSFTKLLYTVMNPGNGGSYQRLTHDQIKNAYNLFFIFK